MVAWQFISKLTYIEAYLQWGDYILATKNLNIIEIIDVFEYKN